MANGNDDILQKVVEEFHKKFTTKFKGETDPEKILDFSNALDNPTLLNKELSELPSQYAYWASMTREARQSVETLKNKIAMWEASKYEGIVDQLHEKGMKTPTQKAIDAELKLTFKNDIKYQNALNTLNKRSEVCDKIQVIEKAVLTKMDCLRIIAGLTSSMMQTGIWIKKPEKKGAF